MTIFLLRRKTDPPQQTTMTQTELDATTSNYGQIPPSNQQAYGETSFSALE